VHYQTFSTKAYLLRKEFDEKNSVDRFQEKLLHDNSVSKNFQCNLKRYFYDTGFKNAK
jgi:hypothetical protein